MPVTINTIIFEIPLALRELMVKFLPFFILFTGCSTMPDQNLLKIIYFEGCRNATDRLCKWNIPCIKKHVQKCEEEANTFAEVASQ